jgi:adenosylcobyric acid synthase
MFQGTGSDVGKSFIVAGLCRVAKRRGISVAPFKPQNMSNNAAVTSEGGEIGRAQWVQALAAKITPSVLMNPVLLKPESDRRAQVIVQGKVWDTAEAKDFQAQKKFLLSKVMESFETLKAEYDLVLVEGAGSPAETNLRKGDIANMGFAVEAGVPVVLIGDIDRGGVIASIVGTHTVLDKRDRGQIVGTIINRFRGDMSLFDDGVRDIFNRTNWPCFGILPWLKGAAKLPAEDAVVLERASGNTDKKRLNISVPGSRTLMILIRWWLKIMSKSHSFHQEGRYQRPPI